MDPDPDHRQEPEQKRIDLLRLHRALHAEPVALSLLLEVAGSPASVFETFDGESLGGVALSPPLRRLLREAASRFVREQTDRDLRWLDAEGHHLIVKGEPGYPSLLAEIADAPLLLFVAGDPTVLTSDQMAIVGSRKMTAAGRRTAGRLAGDLVTSGLTVTSGMALGIDGAAHWGALAARGKTVAVLGCGCDIVYPRSHVRLAERIREAGSIISEFPLGMPARPHHFPRRNRIVTGMSRGTIVVEAALRSGSLVSARLAAEQGREVFAVPGPITGQLSRGCHHLIKTGAKLVEDVGDVLEEFVDLREHREAAAGARIEHLSETAKGVVQMLGREKMSVDALARAAAVDIATLLPTLVELEIEGIVRAGDEGYELAVP